MMIKGVGGGLNVVNKSSYSGPALTRVGFVRPRRIIYTVSDGDFERLGQEASPVDLNLKQA